MKFLPENDTIVALSSPLGKGAIAVVRASGKQCLQIVNPLLKKKLTHAHARQALLNEFYSSSPTQVIDQVVTTYFMEPASYTGEDLVEISCHCNPLIINRIIEALVHAGARVAEPGEFTFRAFMNGKMDLSQAEAVAEVINARTRQSLAQSLRHLEGKFSERIHEIKNDILSYLSLLEINLDFSDEGIEVLPLDLLRERIAQTVHRLERLLHSYDYGRLLQEGIRLVILGKPNVGKSSLLNVLVERERAIVSEIPGTTRDYIEASLEIDGLAVQAIDTAGIRQTDDAVEAMGVQRALALLPSADVALCLFESHRPPDPDDGVLMNLVREHREAVKFVVVLNKADLGVNPEVEKALEPLALPRVNISARTRQGVDELKKTIKKQLFDEESLESEEIVVTGARHKAALEGAREALVNALAAVEQRSTEEIIAVDIRLALDRLGEITGETTAEEVLNHIFANFCIGK